MSLLTFTNIHKHFPGKTVLNGITFSVSEKERVALVGSNGTGKTTLLKIAMGHLSMDNGRVITSRGSKIGYISQTMEQFQSDNMEETALSIKQITDLELKMRDCEEQMKHASKDELDDLLRKYSYLTNEFEAMNGYTKEVELKKILKGLNLDERTINSPVSLLSGGEKMRVLLGRMLIEKPDLLILDEPTNHLDMVAIQWLEEYLKKFSGGILFVSHDRYFLDRTATKIVELEGGTITESKGSFSEYIKQKDILKEFHSNEIKRLKWEIKREREVAQTLLSHRKMNAFHAREKVVNKLIKKLELERSKSTNMHLKLNTGFMDKTSKKNHISKLIAWGEHFSKAYDKKVLFTDTNFIINGGDKVAVIGPNGCGKTTLLNILMGKDINYEGTCTLGTWVKYGYLSQDISFENEQLSILDFIILKTRFDKKKALSLLAEYKFYGDDTSKTISILSGGEKMRLALAQELLKHPYCLILDEPTNHLDIYSKEVMEKLLTDYVGTVIMVSHDRYFINKCANKIIEIDNFKTNMYEGNFGDLDKLKNKKEEPVIIPIKRVNKKAQVNKKEVKVDYKKLEDEITDLEKQLIEMEKLFISDVKYVEYEKYDQIKKKLDKKYLHWESLLELGNR